jgi:hypothetical protein
MHFCKLIIKATCNHSDLNSMPHNVRINWIMKWFDTSSRNFVTRVPPVNNFQFDGSETLACTHARRCHISASLVRYIIQAVIYRLDIRRDDNKRVTAVCFKRPLDPSKLIIPKSWYQGYDSETLICERHGWDSVLPTRKTGALGTDVIVDCNFATTLTTVIATDLRQLHYFCLEK